MIYYLTKEQVIDIHIKMIDLYGGSHGIRDGNLLDSAVTRAKSIYYVNFIDRAAALMESLGGSHPFIDGNKRVAFAAADIFLRTNGYKLNISSFDAYKEIIAMFESNLFKFENIKEWLQRIIIKI